MDVGGFARLLLLKDQLHIKPCPRCGLHYDQRESVCPHCGGLDEHQLARLLEEKEQEHEATAAFGHTSILIGLALAALVILLALKV